MRSLLGLSMMLLAGFSSASETEDVLYKLDGTVLRGTLIEQNFQEGIYKIEILGGSVFVVKSAEISKITKEKVHTNTAEVVLPTVAVPQSQPKPVPAPAPVVSYSASTTSEAENINRITYNAKPYSSAKRLTEYPTHALYIGAAGRTYHMDENTGFNEDTKWRMQGTSYAYQISFNKHWATYFEYADTRLDEITDEDDYAYSITQSEKRDVRATTFQALGVLSSNNEPGLQFYLGGGFFRDRLNLNGHAHRAVGHSVLLGMGYSWQHVETHFRIFVNDSDDYPSEFETQTSSSFQLGYRF